MLQIADLELAYGRAEPVLADVSLSVEQGQFVSLIGPSGCGKSTLLRAVTGLQEPTRGTVDMAVAQREVGFLFQDDALLPWRSARDNVALGLRNHGMRKKSARRE